MTEYIGKNIERMEVLINRVVDPPPSWLRKWHGEAETTLHLAHEAKDSNNLEELRRLDTEAERIVKDFEGRISDN